MKLLFLIALLLAGCSPAPRPPYIDNDPALLEAVEAVEGVRRIVDASYDENDLYLVICVVPGSENVTTAAKIYDASLRIMGFVPALIQMQLAENENSSIPYVWRDGVLDDWQPHGDEGPLECAV